MLLLVNVVFSLWVSSAEGQETCSKVDIHIHNGFFSESYYTYPLNKTTQYSCKPGYLTPEGKTSGSITCLQNGWSVQPTCIKSCDMPVFENARARSKGTWFKLNDKLDYECNDGYESRDGSTTGSIVCGDGGWSGTPTCLERTCSVPIIENTLLAQPQKESYKIGDVLKFSCREKLTIVGPDSIQCYHFGWSPQTPTCKEQVKFCGPPPQLPNGEVQEARKEKYGHSEVVVYDCNPRFLMKGPKKIQCVDGKWTTLPICIEEVRTCGDIPELEHGDVLSSAPPYRHGDSVEFNCRETFTLIGHKTITCVSGMWTELPQCIARDQLKKCKASRLIVHQTYLSNMPEFDHNTKLSYRCKGKSLFGQSICINGMWDPEITCKAKNTQLCPPPPQIPNTEDMTTTVNYQNGEKVSVLCQENYLIQEGEEIVCKDGRWQSIPRCVEKLPCSQPPLIEHGHIQSSRFSEGSEETANLRHYSHGTKLKYTCDDGFRISEEDGVKCHLGKWNPLPQCIGIPCKQPPMISYGAPSSRLDIYQHGEEVRYDCDEGFGIDGPASITCLGGKWPNPPTCKRECYFYFVENGHSPNRENRYLEGQSVNVVCNPRYSLPNDESKITCTKRDWSPPPRCIRVKSCDMPVFENAKARSKDTWFKLNDKLDYECNDGYENTDGSTTGSIVCGEDGWSGTPICPEVTCDPPYIANGFYRPRKTKHRPEDKITYTCKEGFYPSSQGNMAKCTGSGWVPVPRCILKPCDFPNIKHGYLDEENYYRPHFPVAIGTSYFYNCDDYFVTPTQHNNGFIKCTQGGWSPAVPCQRQCYFYSVANGKGHSLNRGNRYLEGQSVNVVCNPGYSLPNDERKITCTEHGWSPHPRCIRISVSCVNPPVVENANIISRLMDRYPPGERVRYECMKSFVIFGEVEVMCLNGTWTEPPKCGGFPWPPLTPTGKGIGAMLSQIQRQNVGSLQL
ncbi:complement factor H-related protein 5 isoform X2 [Dasypus novemcinctus]|uniref:complement factor H-related protein 5 isoform X2 n=1 Tax=Dasypus novemcinctus TaxID=9361 RepID=UPI0039C93782